MALSQTCSLWLTNEPIQHKNPIYVLGLGLGGSGTSRDVSTEELRLSRFHSGYTLATLLPQLKLNLTPPRPQRFLTPAFAGIPPPPM